MALFVQTGNYVKIRTTTLPETSNAEDFERIHISEFGAPSVGAQTISFQDGERTVLTINGDAEAQSYYAADVASLISDVDDFIETLQESGGGSGGTPQIQSDWAQSNNALKDFIKNKPTLADVAISGDYGDLNNAPDLHGYLRTDGSDVAATGAPQECAQGITITDDPDFTDRKVIATSGGISAVSLEDETESNISGNGEVTARSNADSTFSRLLPDGGLLQVSTQGGLVFSVVETRRIEVDLTAAQIKTLDPGTEVIPAPGAGKYIAILGATAFLNFGTEAFDVGSLYLRPNGGALQFGATSFLNSTTSGGRCLIPQAGQAPDEFNFMENASIMVTGDPASVGDSTVTLNITYEIKTL